MTKGHNLSFKVEIIPIIKVGETDLINISTQDAIFIAF